MWSQQAPVAPTDTTTLHVASRLVVLDVVVLDRNGKFVSHLDRSQFTVTEDKVPQAIRSFDPSDGREIPAGSAGKMLVQGSADLPKIGNAPVNILVFDEVNTPFPATGLCTVDDGALSEADARRAAGADTFYRRWCEEDSGAARLYAAASICWRVFGHTQPTRILRCSRIL